MSELYKAIMKVQQEAPMIDKAAKNPFFKSKYADLPIIWKSIRHIMGEAGLVVCHINYHEDGSDFLHTKIVHADTGKSLESVSEMKLAKTTAQEYGSYITYMRRYHLTSMLGLVTDEDDDGNKAVAAQTAKPKPAPKPKPEPTVKQKNDAALKSVYDKREAIDALETEQAVQDYMTANKDWVSKIDAYAEPKKLFNELITEKIVEICGE